MADCHLLPNVIILRDSERMTRTHTQHTHPLIGTMTPCEVITADRKNQLNCGCYRTNDRWMWTRNPGPETKMLQGATETDLLSSPKAQELEEPGSPEHPEVEGRLPFEGMTD